MIYKICDKYRRKYKSMSENMIKKIKHSVERFENGTNYDKALAITSLEAYSNYLAEITDFTQAGVLPKLIFLLRKMLVNQENYMDGVVLHTLNNLARYQEVDESMRKSEIIPYLVELVYQKSDETIGELSYQILAKLAGRNWNHIAIYDAGGIKMFEWYENKYSNLSKNMLDHMVNSNVDLKKLI